MIVMGGSVVPCVWVYCLQSQEAVSCFVSTSNLQESGGNLLCRR